MSYKDNFSEASTVVKTAFFIVVISLFCSWLAFTTTSWLVVDTAAGSSSYPVTVQVHYGLWRICTEKVLGGCSQVDGTAKVEYGVTQAFAIIGFMCQNVAFLLIVRFIFKESCKGDSEVGMGAAILLIISAIGWLIAVAVFGGEFDASATQLHYSYGLAVIACALGLFGGILMALGGANGSVGSK
ncbi:hypothetical protein BsWGS_20748 [Bradybaena similaris]